MTSPPPAGTASALAPSRCWLAPRRLPRALLDPALADLPAGNGEGLVTVRLAIDEPISKATEMGEALGRIFDQDGANLTQVQRGMKAS